MMKRAKIAERPIVRVPLDAEAIPYPVFSMKRSRKRVEPTLRMRLIKARLV
jgi:hypothetical protein